jgi:hypothetical protein
MGFDVGGNSALLEFQGGTPLAGAEIRVSLDMSVRDFLALKKAIREQAMDGESELYRRFGEDYLLSWNLELRGEPLEATGEGMLSLPIARAGEIFSAWMSAMVQPSPN